MGVRIIHPPRQPTYRDTKTDEERRFYSSQAWRITSEQHRQDEPFCRECKSEGTLTLAQCTDHIVPLNQGGHAWDERNLQSLCNFHHNQKRKKESLG